MQTTRVRRYFQPDFFQAVLAIALPMTAQNFIMSAVNMVDVVMIGALGDVAIAAVGVANQVFYIYSILLFGIYSGAAVFLSQFWGRRDIGGIRRTMGLMLVPGIAFSLLFTLAAELAPDLLMGIYSKDPAVIEAGRDYLRIVGFSYLLNGVAFAYAFTCRCTGQVKLPMAASIASVLTNVVFNYLLIYGRLGLPRLGLAGAALATVLARVLECAILLFVVYRRGLPAAARLCELLRFDRRFFLRFLKTTAPVILNEGLWSVGTSLYTVVYGLLGTTALAAVQIVSTVFNLFMVFARSLHNAAAVLIGNKIGAGDEAGAKVYAFNFMGLLPLIGLVMAGLLLAFRPLILSLFSTSAQAYGAAWSLLGMHALIMVFKYFNGLTVVGICRAGGDTVYSAIVDVAPVWLVALPLGFLGAWLQLPVELVFLMISAEELVKIVLGLPRVLSGRWVHNLVAGYEQAEEVSAAEEELLLS